MKREDYWRARDNFHVVRETYQICGGRLVCVQDVVLDNGATVAIAVDPCDRVPIYTVGTSYA